MVENRNKLNVWIFEKTMQSRFTYVIIWEEKRTLRFSKSIETKNKTFPNVTQKKIKIGLLDFKQA